MPEIERGGHVIEWLYEVGPISFGANGAEALSWQEINAWKQATGTEVNTEELLLIRSLSLEYVAQLHAGENPSAKDPTAAKPGTSEARRNAALDFDAMLDSHKKK